MPSTCRSGRKGAGGFDFDQLLVKGGENAGERQHEVGQGGGHVPDEPGSGCVDGPRDDLFLEEFRVVRNESGFFRNSRQGEIVLDLNDVVLHRDYVLLQKTHQIVKDGLILSDPEWSWGLQGL